MKPPAQVMIFLSLLIFLDATMSRITTLAFSPSIMDLDRSQCSSSNSFGFANAFPTPFTMACQIRRTNAFNRDQSLIMRHHQLCCTTLFGMSPKENSGVEGDEKESINSGQELASLFYKQLKERKINQIEDDFYSKEVGSLGNVELNESANPSAYSSNLPSSFSAESPKNFTGALPKARPDFANTGSLFDERPFSSIGVGSSSRNRNTDLEAQRKEIDLASRFEQTIYIQAVALALTFVLVIGVGITGGISNGSDRYFDDNYYDFGNIGSTNNPEVVLEVPNSESRTKSTEAASNIWI